MMKISLKITALLALGLWAGGSPASALSLEECLTLALENHPSLRQAKGSTRAAEAALEQAKVGNRLTVGATGALNYEGDYQEWDDRAWSDRASVTASKLLYDTGRNRLQKERATETLMGRRESQRMTAVSVAAAAKRAYYKLTLDILSREVEREKVYNLEEHLKVAKGLYEVGNSAFIDVTKAEADLAGARVSLLKAESDIRVSREDLRVKMGLETTDEIAPSSGLELPAPAPAIGTLLGTALEDRPDYRQSRHTIRAQELAIQDAARASSPTLTGAVGSTFTDLEGASAGTNYSLGLTLNVPIVDGGLAAAGVEAARAQLDQDFASRDSLRQQITYDVRSAALSLENAVDRSRSAKVSVQYAEQNLDLAQGRYEVGVGDSMELSDAVKALADARYTYYEALYDAQVARSDLDEALGHLPAELAKGDGPVQ